MKVPGGLLDSRRWSTAPRLCSVPGCGPRAKAPILLLPMLNRALSVRGEASLAVSYPLVWEAVILALVSKVYNGEVALLDCRETRQDQAR